MLEEERRLQELREQEERTLREEQAQKEGEEEGNSRMWYGGTGFLKDWRRPRFKWMRILEDWRNQEDWIVTWSMDEVVQ